MAAVTEIYICKNGQALKEGRLELSHTIADRTAAEADAVRRCKIDGAIERIAYYTVGEGESFRNLFTYTNPNGTGKKPPAKMAVRKREKTAPSAKKAERSWLSRLVAAFRA